MFGVGSWNRWVSMRNNRFWQYVEVLYVYSVWINRLLTKLKFISFTHFVP